MREDAGRAGHADELGAAGGQHSIDSERPVRTARAARASRCLVQQLGAVTLPAVQTANVELYEKFRHGGGAQDDVGRPAVAPAPRASRLLFEPGGGGRGRDAGHRGRADRRAGVETPWRLQRAGHRCGADEPASPRSTRSPNVWPRTRTTPGFWPGCASWAMGTVDPVTRGVRRRGGAERRGRVLGDPRRATSACWTGSGGWRSTSRPSSTRRIVATDAYATRGYGSSGSWRATPTASSPMAGTLQRPARHRRAGGQLRLGRPRQRELWWFDARDLASSRGERVFFDWDEGAGVRRSAGPGDVRLRDGEDGVTVATSRAARRPGRLGRGHLGAHGRWRARRLRRGSALAVVAVGGRALSAVRASPRRSLWLSPASHWSWGSRASMTSGATLRAVGRTGSACHSWYPLAGLVTRAGGSSARPGLAAGWRSGGRAACERWPTTPCCDRNCSAPAAPGRRSVHWPEASWWVLGPGRRSLHRGRSRSCAQHGSAFQLLAAGARSVGLLVAHRLVGGPRAWSSQAAQVAGAGHRRGTVA